MKLYGKEIINWKGLAQIPQALQKEKILAAISAGFKSVAEIPILGVSASKVLGSKIIGADPSLASAAPPIVMTATDTVDAPDRGYEALFDEVDMRSSSSKTFELLDISGGVTFYQQLPGEEAKLSKLPTGAKANVGMLRFTGGFPILDDWLRFNEFYKIDELISDTFKRWYDKKADLFYGLLELLSSAINQAFATDDITTINNACAKIVTDMQAAGYGVSATSGFYITCHPNLLMRVYKALAASFMNPNANNNQIVWPIKGVIPTAKVAATSYYVSLAGLKSKRGEWEDLNTREPQRSELKLGADHVWTGAYNGAIGEAKQHRRCALS